MPEWWEKLFGKKEEKPSTPSPWMGLNQQYADKVKSGEFEGFGRNQKHMEEMVAEAKRKRMTGGK